MNIQGSWLDEFISQQIVSKPAGEPIGIHQEMRLFVQVLRLTGPKTTEAIESQRKQGRGE